MLPPALADRAREFLTGNVVEVAPRPAATVLLLRDGSAGLEVYVLRRRTSMTFAAGMHAFPGGAVDPRDVQDESLRWRGPSTAHWARRLGVPEPAARGFVCAAVRETFEESGVLLASATTDDPVAPTGPQWDMDRLALVARDLALSDLLEGRGLELRSDLLAPWAHWVTPRFEPRRYDTWFFLAEPPAGQEARDVSGEADRAVWVRPGDAVAAAEAGEVAMLPPTFVVLEELAAYGSTGDAMAASAGRSLATVMPGWVDHGDKVRFVLPGDPAFPGDDPGGPA